MQLANELITRYGLDPTAEDDEHLTPLHKAVIEGYDEVVKHLIEKQECNAHLINPMNCWSFLHYACESGHTSLIHRLISEYRLNPLSEDEDDLTPIQVAVLNGQVEAVVEMLTQCSIAKDSYGWSLLHFASVAGHTDLIDTLIKQYHLDITDTTDDGDTPLSLACARGQTDTVLHLINYCNCDPYFRDSVGQTLLHYACLGGHIDIIDVLVSQFKLDPQAVDTNGHVPLHTTVIEGNLYTLKHLVENHKCNPHIRDPNGQTLLHYACFYDHTKLIDDLVLEYQLSIAAHDNDGYTPFLLAAKNGQFKVVQYALANYNYNPYLKCSAGKTIFHYACQFGHLDLIEQLGYSFYPTIRDNFGDTPLHLAAKSGHLEAVILLLRNHRCNLFIKGADNSTLLHSACRSSCIQLVEILLSEHKLSFTSRDFKKRTPLQIAAECGKIEIVRLFLEKYKCNPFLLGLDNLTLLHYACQSGNVDLISQLVEKYNLELTAKDFHDRTPLHVAAEHGQLEALKYLMSKLESLGDNEKNLKSNYIDGIKVATTCNSDPTPKDSSGNTLLHSAAMSGQEIIVRHLISNCKQKYQLNARNDNNSTPLCLATMKGHIALVQILLKEFNCCPDIQGYNNWTLIHYASHGGHTDLIHTLVTEYHLDPMIKDQEGFTPLHIAIISGHFESAKHLQELCLCSENTDSDSVPEMTCQVLKSERHTLIEELNSSQFTESYNGWTLLHFLCKNGNMKLIDELIIEHQLDPTVIDDDGYTPLHIAAENGHVEAVRYIYQTIEHNIGIDNDTNPLSIATLKGHRNVVRTLIQDLNCSPFIKDHKGRSLLHCACQSGQTELVDYFITECQVATVLSVDEEGNTPLHISTMYEQEECVNVLLYRYKAPLFVRNNLGKTPLDIAEASKNSKMQLIKDYLKNYSSQIQLTYQELQRLAKKEFSGEKPLLRLFVTGHPGAGKTTLIETLKTNMYSEQLSERRTTVTPHTAGIILSVYDTKFGRVIFYDFAGNWEYYSSHAAILENLDTSEGINLYLIVTDLSEDEDVIIRRYGYWVSFLSYTVKSFNSLSIILPVGSHADMIDKDSIEELLTNINDLLPVFDSRINY